MDEDSPTGDETIETNHSKVKRKSSIKKRPSNRHTTSAGRDDSDDVSVSLLQERLQMTKCYSSSSRGEFAEVPKIS